MSMEHMQIIQLRFAVASKPIARAYISEAEHAQCIVVHCIYAMKQHAKTRNMQCINAVQKHANKTNKSSITITPTQGAAHGMLQEN